MTLTLPKIIRLKRTFLVLAFVIALFLLYIFSFGPVVWLCGATANTGFDDLPAVVRLIYAPRLELLHHLPYVFWDPVALYDAWWIPGAEPDHWKVFRRSWEAFLLLFIAVGFFTWCVVHWVRFFYRAFRQQQP